MSSDDERVTTRRLPRDKLSFDQESTVAMDRLSFDQDPTVVMGQAVVSGHAYLSAGSFKLSIHFTFIFDINCDNNLKLTTSLFDSQSIHSYLPTTALVFAALLRFATNSSPLFCYFNMSEWNG
ncbi:hypothetical protein PsorP6_011474 [Peronosclerospora sorghi]|uniref:Uncharacterized protein n=1 Tax=Peronosclerospora sorghi TaxID=230839 RepID=A0ACC0WIN2_9STRA|nr:hypothetical protein PsorP6_011474 [Peronosclerospora sorghi]